MPTHSSRSPGYSYTYTGVNSTRVNGELKLRSNPCTIKTATRSFCHPEMGAATQGDAFQNSVAFAGWNNLFAAQQTSVYNRALEKFRSKAYMEAQASLAVDIAEAKKTAGMVTDKAKDIFKGVLLLKRGRLRQAAQHFGVAKAQIRRPFKPGLTVAENLLALNLGWKPTVGSILTLMDTVNKPLQNRWIQASAFSPGPSGLVYSGSAARANWTSSSVKCSIGALLNITDAKRATVEQFGLGDPFVVLWELVPMSFVVDYFVNIGQLLAHSRGYPGMSFTDIFVCYTYHLDGGLDTRRTWADGKFEWRRTTTGTYQEKIRTTSHSIPTPRFEVSMDLNLTQASNLFSLMTVMLGQSPGRFRHT